MKLKILIIFHFRQNKRLVTSIFCKATFSGVFTNYDSFISDTYKIGLVHTLLFRFFKICASMENFHIKVQLLRSIFKCNNYPINIMDQCIKKFLDKLYFPKQIVPIVPKKELLVLLPYLGIFLWILESVCIDQLASLYHNSM